MRKGIKKIAAGLVLSGVLLVGVPVSGFAADSTETGGFGLGIGKLYGSMMTVVSDLLGIAPEEVRAQRREGNSILDIAEEKGVTEDQLLEKIVDSRKANLEDAIEKGLITEEQADLCIGQMEERVKSNIDRTTTGRPDWAQGLKAGQGQKMGRGGRMGGGFGMRGIGTQL